MKEYILYFVKKTMKKCIIFLEEMYYLINKGNTVRKCRELILLRNEFHKMLEKFIFVFGDIIIYYKEKAFELFKWFIIEGASINKYNILANFINILDLYAFLKNFYSIIK